jgi:hypothetical protein
MQVSATLIAAQQAAREAQTKFQAAHFMPSAGFSTALAQEGFSALPLKQTAVPAAKPASDATPNSRPGSLLDIRV